MSAQENLIWLHMLLEYEVQSSKRYQRHFSLVMMACGKGSLNCRELLGDIIRGSDELVELDGHASLLMGETDCAGALQAVRRFKDRCNNHIDLRFSVICYPNDGESPAVLLETASRRLEEAKNRGVGALVATG